MENHNTIQRRLITPTFARSQAAVICRGGQGMAKRRIPVLRPKEMSRPSTESSTAPDGEASAAALTAQLWGWVCWTGGKTYDGLEFAGEVIANFLGLTQSQYQWMLDMKEREAQEKRQRRLEARQRRQLRLEQLLEEEKRKLQALERGDHEEVSAAV